MPRKKKTETAENTEKKTGQSVEGVTDNATDEEPKLENKSYELILTEKPQAAMKIAYALGNAEKRSINGVPYYELSYEGKNIVVACAVGHLFGLTSTEKGWPIFNVEWQATYNLGKKSGFTKKYYNAVVQLARNANSFVIATDYDIEGELIGYNVLRNIFRQQDAMRMKFSTLTDHDIVDAYKNMSPTIEWGLALSGETRHMLDWFYGINFSRALMNALSKAGRFRIMSIGRVQGPALAFIVAKERQIQEFKATPYWQVYLVVSNDHKTEVKYERDITKQVELAKFHKLKGKNAIARTEKSEQKIMPGFPFDLTALQVEASRLHGFSPSRVLQIAQQLYLAGLISYPRTSSQKLPRTIGYKKILEKLAKHTELVKHTTRENPVEGKKEDAHPAIFPTGEYEKMNEEQKKLYDLIARRFIACFCSEAVIENKKIIIEIDNLKFTASGLSILEKGWMQVYKARLQEKELLDINGNVVIKEIRIEEKQTQPPHRYSQAGLVSELAKKNLGTKATRASIIDTLYNRGYIKNEPIEATSFGMILISTLEKEAPVIIDEKLTRHFEAECEKIEKNKDKYELQKKIVEEAKKIIIKISESMKKKLEPIGKELTKGYEDLQKENAEQAKIVKCPDCKDGWLVVRKSKVGRQFLACNAYPECRKTLSLPPYGFIKKSEETCSCGFPILMAISKGRRPWKFCFNPECPAKKPHAQIST
ncbi:DNA topoisomerase I [Candidatus Pacearchaeota archaeon]|nr:DNA topoisomerase I [Candidatus Pacearchaeota archaeon]